MRPSLSLVKWTITGTKSDPIKLDGNQIVGFLLPVSIASSSITFNVAITLNTSTTIAWVPVCDSAGSAISFTVTPSTAKYYGFSQDQIAKFSGTELLQIVAGSSEAANQAIYVSLLPRPAQ